MTSSAVEDTEAASFSVQQYLFVKESSTIFKCENTKYFNDYRNRTIVVKQLHLAHANLHQRNKIHKEFEIGKRFKRSQNVVKFLALENYAQGPALVMEDFGGINLREFLDKNAGNLTVEEVLSIAIQIVSALQDIHEQEVIHAALIPEHILVSYSFPSQPSAVSPISPTTTSSASSLLSHSNPISSSSTASSSSSYSSSVSNPSSSPASSSSTEIPSDISQYLLVKLTDFGHSIELKRDRAAPIQYHYPHSSSFSSPGDSMTPSTASSATTSATNSSANSAVTTPSASTTPNVRSLTLQIPSATSSASTSSSSDSECSSPRSTTSSHDSIASSNLKYISPEQTGRMNRDVDYRTDFYSLGVVLYELLAGFCPFDSSDPVEIVYGHIAKSPKPLCEVEPFIPPVVSDIIQILLAKNAEDRYQSSYGLKKDLETALRLVKESKKLKLESSSQPIAEFKLRQYDSGSFLSFNQKLYGREEQVKMLLHAFDEISAGKIPRMAFFVRGFSGIGKSKLIQELYKPLTKERGYFTVGKTDQYEKILPYACFIQAFQNIINTITMEGSERIQYWKHRILQALPNKAQIIIDVIPELEKITGKQPPVPKLSAMDSEVRFISTFKTFVGLFAQREHPLVVFFDDLQWSDISSLKLIEQIVLDSNIENFLLIGAYRDNEVNEVHALTTVLKKLQQRKDIYINISLPPLGLQHVAAMMTDSFNLSESEALALATEIHEKTKGNPFFIIQLVTDLVSKKLIKYNFVKGRWEWKLEEIKLLGYSDNVVHVLLEKMHSMSKSAQNVLSLAASIGNVFDLDVLATVLGKTMEETMEDIWPLLKENMITQMGETYKYVKYFENVEFRFVHDKIQQAAYELTDSKERERIHFTIGKSCMKLFQPKKQNELIFNILSQFKNGKSLIISREDKIMAAELALKGSKKAKECSSFFVCADCAQFGIEILPEDAWDTLYSLWFGLHQQLCEGEYLRGNFTQAETLYPRVIDKCKTVVDKSLIYSIKASQYESQALFDQAIDVLCPSLSLLGVHISLEEEEMLKMIDTELSKVKSLFESKAVEDFAHEAEMKDPVQLMTMHLLVQCWSPAFFCNYGNSYKMNRNLLLALISIKMAAFTMENGICSLSSFAYIAYSFIGGQYTGEFLLAYKIGQLGLQLLESCNDTPLKIKCLFTFYTGTHNHLRPLRESIPALKECWQLALDNYDVFAAYVAHHIVTAKFFAGKNLQKLYAIYLTNFNFLKKRNEFIYRFGFGVTMPFRYLIDQVDEKEERRVQLIIDKHNETFNRSSFCAGRLIRSCWANEYNLDYANEALRICSRAISGFYHYTEVMFFASLCYARHYHKATKEEQEYYLYVIDKTISKFQNLRKGNSGNFVHKMYILQAERARILKEPIDNVLDLFEKACDHAKEHLFIQMEALANELWAIAWLERKKQIYAVQHVKRAYALYNEWGAKAKIRQLTELYPFAIQEPRKTQTTQQNTSSSSIAPKLPQIPQLVTKNTERPEEKGKNETLLIKVLDSLATGVGVEQFLKNAMSIMIEDLGCHRAVLIKQKSHDNLLVLAEGCVENNQIHTSSLIFTAVESYFQDIPTSIIYYVARVQQCIYIDDCLNLQHQFLSDPYFERSNIERNHIKSLLCIPLMTHQKCKGLIFIESRSSSSKNLLEKADLIHSAGVQVLLHLENSNTATIVESEQKYKLLFNKLAASKRQLEEFIDILCHEVRNPLSAIFVTKDLIKANIQSLEVASEADAADIRESQEALSNLSTSTDLLKDTVDTVLSLSQLQHKSVKLQNVLFQLGEVINDVTSVYKFKIAEKGLKLFLNLDFPPELVLIGDPFRLKEVLLNLLSNAYKFTTKGFIRISAAIAKDKFSKNSRMRRVRFELMDTGMGFNEEEKRTVFKIWSSSSHINSTSPSFGKSSSHPMTNISSSGLGLKITKELVELMQGSISLESEEAKFTRFCFDIVCEKATRQQADEYWSNHLNPVSPAEPASASAATPSSSSPERTANPTESKSLHILITDDNAINQKLLAKILQQLGHTSEVASNGMEALNKLKEKQFSLCFMDFNMPVMNGIDASIAFREYEKQQNYTHQLPIVGISGNQKETLSQRAAEVMNGFIMKPFLMRDISHAIEKHCAHR